MIKSKIIDLLKKVVKEDIKIEIFVPENENFGHYSTNVALKLGMRKPEQSSMRKAHANKKNTMVIAEEIKKPLSQVEAGEFFQKIEIAPPGFINFWLSEKTLQNELKEILKNKKNYGKLKPKNQNLKPIQIEFISANPTGPLTLANGRGGFFGDVLSNILEFSGYKIEREYYINDTGNQILTLGKSILANAGLLKWDENFYKGGYVKDWAKKHKLVVKKYKDEPLKVGKLAAKDFLKTIKKVLKEKTSINYDRWTSEDKNIHKKNYINKVLDIFERKNLVYDKDNATWLKTTDFGDDKDRVLVTSDGFPTYFLADAGHYLETKERGFGGKIAVWGPDHYGYVKRIQTAAEIIGFKNSEIIITQAVRLMSRGKEVKMSKRTGEFVTFEELIKEVGADAARFFFLMHSPETHMDFDIDLAKEHSMKNPVYYLQYAAVRAQGILRKSNVKGQMSNANLNLLNTPEDMNLMRILARFPEIIEEGAKNYSPQILARYSLDLARQFHNFYEKERIIPPSLKLRRASGEEKDLMAVRLELIKAAQIIFKNIFQLLGISMPKKM